MKTLKEKLNESIAIAGGKDIEIIEIFVKSKEVLDQITDVERFPLKEEIGVIGQGITGKYKGIPIVLFPLMENDIDFTYFLKKREQ